MAVRGDNNFMRYDYVYRGEDWVSEDIIIERFIVHESVTVVIGDTMRESKSMVEAICHDKVEKIGEYFFELCGDLRRVIMPGVKIVERYAFLYCEALTDVECGKLENVGVRAFYGCESLKSIELPSARIVQWEAFATCGALTDVKFGGKLERIEDDAFENCTSLERITIPLKDGIIAERADDVFTGCEKLKHVDLVEGELLRETIAALHLEEWRSHMDEEIDSINQILPSAMASGVTKGSAIRRWIRSVLRKIMHYKAQHCRLLGEDVAPTLQRILPQDIVMNSILPFLELPSHAFVDWNLHEDEEDDSESDDEEMEEEE